MRSLLIIVTVAVAGGIGWYLASPLFIDTVVDEPAPFNPGALSDEERNRMRMVESVTGVPLTGVSQEDAEALMREADRMMHPGDAMSAAEKQRMENEIRREFYTLRQKYEEQYARRQAEAMEGMNDEEVRMMEKMETMTREDVEAMPEEEQMVMKEEMEEMAAHMPDQEVDEPMMHADAASSSMSSPENRISESTVSSASSISSVAPAPPESSVSSAPSGPSVAARGQFRGFDSFHKGSGDAIVFELEDKTHLLRLENFSVTNGPALHVYLVKNANGDPESGYVDLGDLKGNKGNQNYSIPPDVDIEDYESVLIYCVPFGVRFAVAPLS